MLHNPNVGSEESVLVPYYQGNDPGSLPWPKLEEYGYQFFLDGTVFLPTSEQGLNEIFDHFEAPVWFWDEDTKIPLIRETARNEDYVRYEATPQGRDVFDVIYEDYQRIFLD